MLWGLCYYNQRLFTVEWQDGSYSLCMYQVSGQGLTLLDTMALKWAQYPRVDGHSQQVYVPRGEFRGVSVVSWEDSRLTSEANLECVGTCISVGVMSSHTLYVCDEDSHSVSAVSKTNDTVTARLSKPEEMKDKEPLSTAVLGESVLVEYEGDNLVVYENRVSSPGTMVTWPAGLQTVYGISSDGVSRFLVCDWKSKAVFTLDVSGKLCDKIHIETSSYVRDCTVVDGKLWVGCFIGDIVVLSPQ